MQVQCNVATPQNVLGTAIIHCPYGNSGWTVPSADEWYFYL
jgi:hypothetical protein